jgi:hypothetical protein
VFVWVALSNKQHKRDRLSVAAIVVRDPHVDAVVGRAPLDGWDRVAAVWVCAGQQVRRWIEQTVSKQTFAGSIAHHVALRAIGAVAEIPDLKGWVVVASNVCARECDELGKSQKKRRKTTFWWQVRHNIVLMHLSI